eukprot:scaffold24488_cov60-Phaeocystis_antarctica.AAC.3
MAGQPERICLSVADAGRCWPMLADAGRCWPILAEAGGRPELDLACPKAGRGVLEGDTALAGAIRFWAAVLFRRGGAPLGSARRGGGLGVEGQERLYAAGGGSTLLLRRCPLRGVG